MNLLRIIKKYDIEITLVIIQKKYHIKSVLIKYGVLLNVRGCSSDKERFNMVFIWVSQNSFKFENPEEHMHNCSPSVVWSK